MHKLIAVIAVLALALGLAACGSVSYTTTTTTIQKLKHSAEQDSNVEGLWRLYRGFKHEEVVMFSYRNGHHYSRSNFVADQEGIHLKLGPKATLVEAGGYYTGVDLFYKKWNGSGTLPFVKTFTDSTGKKHRLKLVEAWVGIHDTTGLKPEIPKQSSS